MLLPLRTPAGLPRTQRRSRTVQYLWPCHKGQGARRRLAALLPRPVRRDRGLVVIAAHRLHAQAPRVPHHLAMAAGASFACRACNRHCGADHAQRLGATALAVC